MLLFLICADEETGRRECHARGWVQAGVTRFYTPERDDVRVIRRFVDIALLPGGTWLMAGKDFWLNPEAGKFCGLIDGGHAQWVNSREPGPPPTEPVAPDPPPPPPKTLLTEVSPPRRYRATKAEMYERRRLLAEKTQIPPPPDKEELPPWETFREEMS
jgi:hypothetical protein